MSNEQLYLDYIVVSVNSGDYKIIPKVAVGINIPLLDPPMALSEFRGTPADFEQKAIAAFNCNPVYPKEANYMLA